jgi:hypothetical protein
MKALLIRKAKNVKIDFLPRVVIPFYPVKEHNAASSCGFVVDCFVVA